MDSTNPKPLIGQAAALVALVVALLMALGFALSGCNLTPVGSQQGYSPVQPIAFSHALHAGENKLDCKYCHFGSLESRHAGVPPANVCMNCHTQVKKDSPEIKKIADAVANEKPIEWVKVHRLPDHAYFNHSNHVSAGVKCQTCHGPIETMVRVQQVETMTMGWCLDCHRSSPELNGKTFHPTTDCSGCHR